MWRLVQVGLLCDGTRVRFRTPLLPGYEIYTGTIRLNSVVNINGATTYVYSVSDIRDKYGNRCGRDGKPYDNKGIAIGDYRIIEIM